MVPALPPPVAKVAIATLLPLKSTAGAPNKEYTLAVWYGPTVTLPTWAQEALTLPKLNQEGRELTASENTKLAPTEG